MDLMKFLKKLLFLIQNSGTVSGSRDGPHGYGFGGKQSRLNLLKTACLWREIIVDQED